MTEDTKNPTIRPFVLETDSIAVRALSIELQDVERSLDERLPTGAAIADDYLSQLLGQCKSMDGEILVAEHNQTIVGYACILTRVQSDGVQDGDLTYGLVQDLAVTAAERGKGIGQALLKAAEARARENGVKWLRIGLLASNAAAHRLYSTNGYSKLYVELEKDIEQYQ